MATTAAITGIRSAPTAKKVDTRTPEQIKMEEEFAKIMGDTEGRAGELKADTGYGGVGDFLRGVVGGQNVPYSPEAVNAMQSQFGRGSAAAEAAQLAALRESMGASGGSIYDPSYQAAARQAMGTRQGQNLDYAGQLAADASVKNNAAQMQAAGQVGSLDATRQAQINALLGQGAQYRSQQSATKETGGNFAMPTSNIAKPAGNVFSSASDAMWNAKPAAPSTASVSYGSPTTTMQRKPATPVYQNPVLGVSGSNPYLGAGGATQMNQFNSKTIGKQRI